jgi:hypothetical protein
LLVFVVSLLGGCITGSLVGHAAPTDLSASAVTGAMMAGNKTVRFVCNDKGCEPFVRAAELVEVGVCHEPSRVWAVSAGSSLVCALLFVFGLALHDRRVARLSARAQHAAILSRLDAEATERPQATPTPP